jgi:oligo-1,6-glucosidase
MSDLTLTETPTWWKETVFYQIYPRSFADSNGDGIGDLRGITSKLEYLQQLGISGLWISPIYASPKDDNGYDISDYLAIDPDYGTLEDFFALSSELKRRGMRLILDQVLNHTSDEHPWFIESRSSRTNPKRDWYLWVDAKGRDAAGKPLRPNNWKCAFEGPTWEWDETTEQFYLHLFAKKQPDLNWANPEVRSALYDVLRTWVDRGVDGFRLDAIDVIAKPEGYPDVPAPEGSTAEILPLNERACNHPPVHEYLREMYREVFAGKDLYAVGETWMIGPENTLDFTGYDSGKLHAGFYFYFHWAPTGREQFENFYKLYQASWGRGWLTVTLGNHDSRRILSKFGDPTNHRHASATLLATWLLTLPATPFLFQGDELGLSDMTFDTIEDYRDIMTVNRYHTAISEGKAAEDALNSVRGDSRDNSRTPIPWGEGIGAGFSTGEPWMKVAEVHRAHHAEGALQDPHSIFHGYAALLRLREQYRSLVYGDLTPLVEPGKIIAYRRGAWEGHPAINVVLNWSSELQSWPVTAPAQPPLYANYSAVQTDGLRPWEAVIFLA